MSDALSRMRSRTGPVHRCRLIRGARLGCALAMLLICGACASEIGDSCQDNIDCSTRGDRICDTAQFEGYCTVQGCSARSCPDDSLCVAFFPIGFLTVPCDPQREDTVAQGVEATDDCRLDEVCLSSGLCAQASQEQRFCMKPCGGDGDCRSGYQCARTGANGAEAVPDPDKHQQTPIQRFCRQQVVR